MNADFTGSLKQFAFDNVHPKRAYQLTDGTCFVFGRHFKGQAFSASAQLDSTGHMKTLADETTQIFIIAIFITLAELNAPWRREVLPILLHRT